MSSPKMIRTPEPSPAPGLFGPILKRFGYGVLISLAVLTVAVINLALIAPPEPLTVVRAQTEIARFTVFQPKLATFFTGGMRLRHFDADWSNQCSDQVLGRAAAIEPKIGQSVVYAMTAEGLTITIGDVEGDEEAEVAVLRGTRDGRPDVVSISGVVQLVADASCGGRKADRLPIWGPGEIGGEPAFRNNGPAPTMIEAEVQIFGRAADLLFMAGDRELYAIFEEPMRLPPGAQIGTVPQQGETDSQLMALRGFATLAEGGLLDVQVATEARELFVIPPGGLTKAPDRVRIGPFAQILNDPNVLRAQALVIAFVVLLPIAFELVRPAGRDES